MRIDRRSFVKAGRTANATVVRTMGDEGVKRLTGKPRRPTRGTGEVLPVRPPIVENESPRATDRSNNRVIPGG